MSRYNLLTTEINYIQALGAIKSNTIAAAKITEGETSEEEILLKGMELMLSENITQIERFSNFVLLQNFTNTQLKEYIETSPKFLDTLTSALFAMLMIGDMKYPEGSKRKFFAGIEREFTNSVSIDSVEDFYQLFKTYGDLSEYIMNGRFLQEDRFYDSLKKSAFIIKQMG